MSPTRHRPASTTTLTLSPNVPLSTASDFGRTFFADGNLGTDHGWGGHHCIVGGLVRGQRTYDIFPNLANFPHPDLGFLNPLA